MGISEGSSEVHCKYALLGTFLEVPLVHPSLHYACLRVASSEGFRGSSVRVNGCRSQSLCVIIQLGL